MRYKEGVSINTLDNVGAIFTASYSTAEYDNIIFRFPATSLKLPKNNSQDDDVLFADSEGEEKTISKEDIEKIFYHFNEDTYDFIPLMLGYRLGLRQSEALGLTWNVLDFDISVLRLRRQVRWSETKNCFIICKLKHDKTGKGRDIHIDTNTLEVLKELKQRKRQNEITTKRFHSYYSDESIITTEETNRKLDFVCVDRYGERLTPNSLERIVNIIRCDLGG